MINITPSGNPGLSIASGKTLTGSNTLTLAGTDGTTVTFPSTSSSVARIDADSSFTAAQTITLAPAANTASTGLLLSDTTASTTGNQQYSPAIRFTGQGWKTNSTAASQATDFRIYNIPIQSTSNPNAMLIFDTSVNGAGFAQMCAIDQSGNIFSGSSFVLGSNGSGTTNLLNYNVSIQQTAQYTPADFVYKWNSQNHGAISIFSGGAADTGIARNAAGITEINNGTAGTFRDIKARYFYTSVTNDASQAGAIGEYVSSLVAVGSPQSLSNGTAANITSISLTAGDWDVTGQVNFSETTSTVTGRSAGISSTSATLPTDGSEGYCGVQSTVTSETNTITLSRKQISLSSTTTIYLVGKATFSAGTCGGFGAITARRVR